MSSSDATGSEALEPPRVLIYSSEIPQTGTAGGLLLFRMLRDYPPDRLAIVGDAPSEDSELLRSKYAAIQMPWRRFERSRFNRWQRTLRCVGLVPLYSPNRVDELLGSFQPQVVLTVMQHGTWYDSALRYAKAKRLPIVTIVHDTNESFDKVLPWAVDLQRRRDGRFYQYASRRLCVSPEMEEFCHRKFNARGEVLYPIRDDALAPRPIEESRQLKKAGVLTLGFAGNLGYGYGEQLVRMLPALRQARARVVVFGRRPGPDCVELERATDCIDLRGFVPSKQAWDGIKQECDAVIFPYLNPAGRMQLLYSHHFPSKLAEYLALGMPVFMAGPAEATGVRWASANPSAVLLETALDCESMAASLGRLREDAPMRMAMAAAALAAGSASFDPVAIRDQMIKALRAAAVARSF